MLSRGGAERGFRGLELRIYPPPPRTPMMNTAYEGGIADITY